MRKIRSEPWAFISNMYPSKEDVSYGSFVQSSHDDLCRSGFRINKMVVIRGRPSGLDRIKSYAEHYARLAVLLFQPSIRYWYVHYASHHCLLPALGARLLDKRVVVNIHGDDLALAHATLYRRIMAIGQVELLRSSRLVVVPSLYFKELLLQRLPNMDAEHVVVSPSSGIDFHALKSATSNRPCYWDCDPSQRVAEIGYIGRIDADKGWEALFEAFITLPVALRSRARLHFWGQGKESARMHERIAKEGEGRVFYYGAIPSSELPAAHARFDFHVVPSVRESLGLAALEGLGAGHVLICKAIRPFTDITCDGISAFHVNESQGPDLQTVLANVLQTADNDLRSVAENGQKLARAFDRSSVATALANQIDAHLVA